MSIKGASCDLYVGKKESNLITFWGNKKRIDYESLKRIEFSYAKMGEIGYMKFIDNDNKSIRFEFTRRANEQIERTIELIHENNPDLSIAEFRVEDLKFHQRWWFSILMMFCCFTPVGLFLMWYNKKFTRAGRILITFLMLLLGFTGIYTSYRRYVNAVNDFTNIYNQTYESIMDQTYAPINGAESEATVSGSTEAFATTLTTGHYLVGTDIPVGTYNFYSKKGTGNLISSDGTVNVIFDHNKESGNNIGLDDFGTEELNNIYLTEGIILTITGNQEISAGCDDGMVDSMVKRDQEGLEEIEIGYGQYGASDNIPAGTYDIEWIEGRGNIICSSSTDHGINEIMGESTGTDELDKTIIKKFRNLTLNEGDILEVDEIKVKLTPSK